MAGSFHVIAVVLAIAGASKLADPRPASRLLGRLRGDVGHVRGFNLLIRLAALIEIAVGVSVLVVGGRVPALTMAATHLVFVAVVIASIRQSAMRAGTDNRRTYAGTAQAGDAGCGCFGATGSAPLGRLHLGLTLASVVVALVAVARPVPPVHRLVDDRVLDGGTYLALLIVGAFVLRALYTDGAEVAAAVRLARARTTAS